MRLRGRGRDREESRPRRHHWATMTCVLHCHKHSGVHEKCMRTNIFGRMCVCDMSRLVVWSGLRMTLSLRASVSGCDNMCDLWKMISKQSTCKRAEQPSPPQQWLPGHSQEANSSGTDCKKGKNLRCRCSGQERGESDPTALEKPEQNGLATEDTLSPRQRGALGQERKAAVS